VGDITMRTCFWLFGWLYLALGANPTSYFWLKLFFGNLAIIRVFRGALDWFSSISGARIMVHKPSSWQKSKICSDARPSK